VEGFRTRRINFTFRYVPDEHVIPFERLSPEKQADILPYLRELAARSPFFARALERAGHQR
jgi:antitoxin component of RelBE/YafQ-DinJ toxin-antitoxin module